MEEKNVIDWIRGQRLEESTIRPSRSPCLRICVVDYSLDCIRSARVLKSETPCSS